MTWTEALYSWRSASIGIQRGSAAGGHEAEDHADRGGEDEGDDVDLRIEQEGHARSASARPTHRPSASAIADDAADARKA